MRHKIISAWFLPAILCVASAIANAAPERGELINHPNFTLNGCPLDREWTDEVVTEALALKPRMLERLKNRFSIDKQQLCYGNWDDLVGFIRQANNPKHRTDQPDQALSFRAMQQRDETGKVKPSGLLEALSQRAAMLPSANFAKSIEPNAAGIASGNWTWLGPGNIGGRVRAISPHPTTANEILIGSVSGGIWRTITGGASWTPLTDFLPNVAVACLVRDPGNASIIYACTGEGFFNQDQVRGLGIFKSIDNGNTWAQMASTNPPTAGGDWYYVNRLTIHPTNPLIMLAATDGGAYRSTDGGSSWTKTYGGASPNIRRVLDIAFNPVNGNIAVLGEGRRNNGVATDGAGVAYSADGGMTWTRTKLNTVATFSGNSAGRVEIAIAKSDPTIVYAFVDMNAGELYKSIDGGLTWTPNAPLANNTALTNVLSNQGWYDCTIWVAPNDPNRIIVGGVGLRMSINGGAAWTAITYIHSDHHALVSDPNYATNGTIYGGNDGGVHKSANANTPTPTSTLPSWTNLNNGLGITQFYGGAGKAGARITGGTQDNGSLYWTGTTNWVRMFGADGGDSAADPADGNYIYGETQNGGVVRYTQALTGLANGGEYICAGILDADCAFAGGPNVKINFIPPIRLDQNNPNTLLVGADQLWRSNNVKVVDKTTVTWTSIKPSLGINFDYISAIAVATGNSDIIWVGYNNGQVACTTNGTAAMPTWIAVPGTPARMVTRITIDDTNSNRVFVANGSYSTGNLNVTALGCTAAPAYTNIHNQLPAAPIRAIVRHPTQASWLYAGTEVGLFTSENNGASWFTTNDGPGTVSVEELFFLDASTLIASTHGRGMYSATAAVGPGTVQFSVAAQSVLESAGLATVTVNRINGIAGAIAVNYATASGSATSGSDFTSTSGTLTWPDADGTSRTITIPITNDAVVEPTETFTVSLSSPTGGAVIGTPATQTISIITEVFPANCQLPAGWTMPVGANASWSVVNNDSNEGACSLKSNTITHFQKAQIQFTGTFVAGNVTFDRKVSSELSYDCFRFYIDTAQQIGGTCDGPSPGTLQTGASGEIAWGSVSVPITPGPHTLIWSYEKDSSDIPPIGQDAAWIDAVVLPLPVVASTTTVTSSVNPSALGQAVTFTATVTGSAGTPQGTATFKDGGTTICNQVAMTAGSAQCVTSSLAIASHSITADYSGSAAYSASTSAPLTQVVNAAQVPGAPTIGTATSGNAQATITFTAPASDGGSPITSYTASCAPGPLTGSAMSSPVTVINLVNNTLYTCSVKASNSIGASLASATVTVTPSAGAPPSLASVFSRKNHAGLGPFDVNINTSVLAITGPVSVEPRAIGSGHTIYFRFNNAINNPGSVAVVDGNNAAVAATPAASGSDVIVTIPSLADNKRITITLTGIMGPTGNVNPQPVSMGFLVGDFNSNRAVNASDISALKAQSGTPVTQSNFKFDVNTSGDITSTDVSAVKARAGLALP